MACLEGVIWCTCVYLRYGPKKRWHHIRTQRPCPVYICNSPARDRCVPSRASPNAHSTPMGAGNEGSRSQTMPSSAFLAVRRGGHTYALLSRTPPSSTWSRMIPMRTPMRCSATGPRMRCGCGIQISPLATYPYFESAGPPPGPCICQEAGRYFLPSLQNQRGRNGCCGRTCMFPHRSDGA